jgi:carbonic anhydrase
MSAIDDLLENAQRYARGFDKGGLATPPARRVAVLACMDARLMPTRILGLEEGEAHVIRNAGGVASDDAIRSLAISQNLLGTEEIMLIAHTDCGMLAEGDEELADRLAERAGERPPWPLHTFADVEAGVRDSIARLRASPFIARKDALRGFVYEVETGRLREVA